VARSVTSRCGVRRAAAPERKMVTRPAAAGPHAATPQRGVVALPSSNSAPENYLLKSSTTTMRAHHQTARNFGGDTSENESYEPVTYLLAHLTVFAITITSPNLNPIDDISEL